MACGRLSPNKQYGLLLDLWDEVRDDVGGRLVILGDGIEHERLSRRLPPGAELPGFVDAATKRQLLTDAWLFLHVARQEGWGLVLLEAAAAGTPSLALDAAGVRDAIVDGESGVLARDPDHFAKAWIELTRDPVQRASLAAGARARAELFRWERTVAQFEAVLHEAVGARRRCALASGPWRRGGAAIVAEEALVYVQVDMDQDLVYLADVADADRLSVMISGTEDLRPADQVLGEAGSIDADDPDHAWLDVGWLRMKGAVHRGWRLGRAVRRAAGQGGARGLAQRGSDAGAGPGRVEPGRGAGQGDRLRSSSAADRRSP